MGNVCSCCLKQGSSDMNEVTAVPLKSKDEKDDVPNESTKLLTKAESPITHSEPILIQVHLICI